MTQKQTLDEKRIFLQQQAEDIIAIAESQSNSASICLHKIYALGGTTEKAYIAVQQRILADNDAQSAYYAIALCQQTADLPFDVSLLVDVVVEYGSIDLLQKLLKLFQQQNIAMTDNPLIERIENRLIVLGV